MREQFEVDVLIAGGGVAGLWVLNRLRSAGFDAVLVDRNPLGTGQTIAAQGIIHSGVKYTFDGVMRPQTEALSSMPKIWMDSIAGRDEVDLRGTEVLSQHQFMWSPGGLMGRLVAAMASKAMRSDVTSLERAEWPTIFSDERFSGKVYRLEEPVLATKSVISALATRQKQFCCRATVTELRQQSGKVAQVELARLSGEPITVRPRACVFTAGEGNEFFATQLGLEPTKVAQRRALRMFMARGAAQTLYAHCLVPEPKPRVTITTHELDGEKVWYLGGNIAEKAVGMSDQKALRWASSEMRELFPWLDWSQIRWAIHDVDRAEPHASKLLPTGPTLTIAGNAAIAWPTKMAFAPVLGDKTLNWLAAQNIAPSRRTTELPLPLAEPARYPWEEVREWRRSE